MGLVVVAPLSASAMNTPVSVARPMSASVRPSSVPSWTPSLSESTLPGLVSLPLTVPDRSASSSPSRRPSSSVSASLGLVVVVPPSASGAQGLPGPVSVPT